MGSPPELESLNSMLRIAKIISMIFMILFLLGALFGLALAAIFLGLGLFAIPFVIFFIIDLVIWMQIKEIQNLVAQGQYARAKEKTFLWMILGLILGGILIGIFLILAYVKFDPVINWQRSMTQGGQPGWGAPAAAPGWGQPSQPQPGWNPPPQQPQAQPAWSPPPAQPSTSTGWSSPPASSAPAAPQPAMAPAPAAAPAAPQAMTCPRCGKPATWIAQYSRWYCYTDAQYV